MKKYLVKMSRNFMIYMQVKYNKGSKVDSLPLHSFVLNSTSLALLQPATYCHR